MVEIQQKKNLFTWTSNQQTKKRNRSLQQEHSGYGVNQVMKAPWTNNPTDAEFSLYQAIYCLEARSWHH